MRKFKYICKSWHKKRCGGKPCKVKIWVEGGDNTDTPDSPDACIYKLSSRTEKEEWADWELIKGDNQ